MQGTAMLLCRRMCMCMLFVVTAATSLVYLLLVLLVDTVPVNAYMIWCNVMEADHLVCQCLLFFHTVMTFGLQMRYLKESNRCRKYASSENKSRWHN
jgi:hypothetical protein